MKKLLTTWFASTLLLAVGAAAIGWSAGVDRLSVGATAIAFGVFAVAFLAGGVANAWAGRALQRRLPAGRLVTLAVAVPNLFVLPFGTALGIYAFWCSCTMRRAPGSASARRRERRVRFDRRRALATAHATD